MPASVVILSVYMCCATVFVQIAIACGCNAAKPRLFVSPFVFVFVFFLHCLLVEAKWTALTQSYVSVSVKFAHSLRDFHSWVQH